MNTFQLGNFTVGAENGDPFFILGPCGLEEEDFVWRMARALKEIADRLEIKWVFKASYDKANRTSVDSYRGPGVEEGCRILGEIGKELGVPVTTDVHTPEEIEVAAKTIDLLQIPAFLCRQTDLLAAAAKSGRPVNVKKGQFLAPWDIKPIIGKMEHFDCHQFAMTERGSTFGYNNLVADMRSLPWMREQGVPPQVEMASSPPFSLAVPSPPESMASLWKFTRTPLRLFPMARTKSLFLKSKKS